MEINLQSAMCTKTWPFINFENTLEWEESDDEAGLLSSESSGNILQERPPSKSCPDDAVEGV